MCSPICAYQARIARIVKTRRQTSRAPLSSPSLSSNCLLVPERSYGPAYGITVYIYNAFWSESDSAARRWYCRTETYTIDWEEVGSRSLRIRIFAFSASGFGPQILQWIDTSSALTLLVCDRKGIRPVRSLVCWWWRLTGALNFARLI